MATARIWQTFATATRSQRQTGDPWRPAKLTQAIIEDLVNPLLNDPLEVDIVEWPLSPPTERLVENPDDIRDGGVLWWFFKMAMRGDLDYTDHANVVLTAQESVLDIEGSHVVGLGTPMGLAVSGMGARLADASREDIGRIRVDAPALAMQVITHELGHMIDMDHDQGHARRWNGSWAYVSSPMVSGYFGADLGGFRGAETACGRTNATVEHDDPLFGWQIDFTDCEEQGTELYDGSGDGMEAALADPDALRESICLMRSPESHPLRGVDPDRAP